MKVSGPIKERADNRRLTQSYSYRVVDDYRFRVAAWCCGRGACRLDREVPVTLVFTQSNVPAENVMRDLFFPYFYQDEEYDMPRRDEETVCWTFLRLYWLLSDWQNIIREIERELEEAVCIRIV